MTVTATFTEATHGRQVVGKQRVISGYFTLTGSYAAGGFAITAAMFGLSTIERVQVSGVAEVATAGVLAVGAVWDQAASKISLFESAGDGDPFDESNIADTDTIIVHVTVYGR